MPSLTDEKLSTKPEKKTSTHVQVNLRMRKIDMPVFDYNFRSYAYPNIDPKTFVDLTMNLDVKFNAWNISTQMSAVGNEVFIIKG